MLTKAKTVTALSLGMLAVTAAACAAIAYQTGEILRTQRAALAELETQSNQLLVPERAASER